MNDEKIKFFKLNTLLLVILLSLGIYLRIAGIDKPEGLWYDEMNTYFIASRHFPFEIFKTLITRDLHFPLYYTVLHFWMNLFGNSDIALRALSLLFGILTLPVSYLIGKELYGTKGGLATLCMFSVNAGLIYYSQEVRFYSAIVLFCSLAALFLIKIRDNPSKANCVGLIISNALIIHTFTIGCVFVFIELALFLLYLIYTKRDKKYFLLSVLGIFILSLPIIPLLVYFSIKHSNLLFDYFDWYQFSSGYLSQFIQSIGGPINPRYGISNGGLIDSLILISTMIFFIFVIKSITRRKIVLTLFLIGFIPVLIEIFFALQGQFAFIYCHTIFSIPFFIIAAACGLFQFKNRLIPCVLLATYLTINLSYTFFSPNSVNFVQKSDGFNILSKELTSQHATNQDVLILIPYGSNAAIKYDLKARIAPLRLNDYSFYSGDAFKYILEPDFIKSLNKDNVYYKLKDFASSKQPTTRFENFIKQQTNTIGKNRYVFVTLVSYVKPHKYNEKHMIDCLRFKIARDTLSILNKDKNFAPANLTSSQGWLFFTFKRIK